jgi:hypothetical protein
VLRSARQEWRSYTPVDRAEGKASQTQFDTLVKNMQDRLDAQYRTNSSQKQSLIEQVRRLLNESDTRKAIDDVKRLQAAWKSAGVVPHQEDQRLWEEFRQQCDAVYRRSQEEYAKFVTELESNKTRAVALSGQIEQLAQLEGSDLDAAAAQVRQAQNDFDALGELPRSESASLQSRFHRALEQYERAVVQQRSRNEQQSWSHLFAASNEIRLLQLATLDGQADLEAMRRSVRATIDGVSQWPKGGLQAIERKLSQPVPSDVAANEAALRTLCIRAEILTDTPTPASDQQARRDYQLQTLVKGIGQPQGSGKSAFEALVFEWIGTGPTGTKVYYELLERFNACLLKAQRLAT